MLIGESIQRLQAAYSRGMSSDDSRLGNRHCYSKLRSVRIRVISQTISKHQIVSQWCYQQVTVKMKEVSKHECAEISSDTCKVLKSVNPIPAIFTSLNRHLIQSVTSVDGSVGFGETTWEQIRFNKKGRKYTADLPEFYIKGGYLYITVKKVQDLVLLTALFNDPIQAAVYSDQCGNQKSSCLSYLDYDLAIDGKMEDAIVEMSKEELVYEFSQMTEDRLNNAVDNITQPQRRRGSQQQEQYE